MYSDTLVPMGIFAIYYLVNAVLKNMNIVNSLVNLTFIYIFCHLFFTVLMYFQLNSCQHVEKADQINYSSTAAILTSIVVVLFYIFIGATPFFRYVFFPFMIFPEHIGDHLVVSMPALGLHVFSRYLIKNMVGADGC